MPLVGPALKSKFKSTIMSGLKREFAGTGDPPFDPSWEKIAAAVADIASDIVDALHNDAQVAPGIPVVGAGGGIPGPMSGATTAPGKIL
jgi:hypothetical protein